MIKGVATAGGLVVDSTATRHEGRGTASLAAFFENGYVRAAAWRRSGASPFGVGLHSLSGTLSDLKMPVRLLLRQPQESLRR